MPGQIEERLQWVFIDDIGFIEAASLPEDIQARHEELIQRATSKSPELANEGQIQATLRQMKQDDLKQLANDILNLALLLEQRCHEDDQD